MTALIMVESSSSREWKCYSDDIVECDFVILDNFDSNLFFKKENVSIKLTELQRRFILCLLKGIYKKNDIIRAVWFCNHKTISDNNYYQMIFQCRSLLSRHGIPGEVIKTIPRFGVMLSFQACERASLANSPGKSLASSAKKHWRTWLDIVNYKVALLITLLFSVAMMVSIST